MVADATLKPAPYEAVIVHSLSRFFRDFLEFALYERNWKHVDVEHILPREHALIDRLKQTVGHGVMLV